MTTRPQLVAHPEPDWLEEVLAVERRATIGRLLDDIERWVQQPGAFSKGEILRHLERIREDQWK